MPSSTLHSGVDSDSDTYSMTSSLEHPIRDLHFLNKSWPVLDKSDNHLAFENALTLNESSLDSWNKFSVWKEADDASLNSTYCWNKSNHGYNIYNGNALDSSYGGRPSSQPNSRKSSPGLYSGQGLDCSWNSSGSSPDSMALYSYRGTHYNPSGSGQRTSQEIEVVSSCSM